MMLLVFFFVALASLSVEVRASWAQEKPEIARLSAITVNLKGDSDSEIYRNIWKDVFDKEIERRIKFSELTKRPPIFTTDMFIAAFKVPEGSIIVSSTGTPDIGCRTYTAVGLSPNLMTCPVRVALLQGEKSRVIYSSSDYTFVLAVREDGKFDNTSDKTRTLVTFNLSSKSLYTHPEDASRIDSIAPTANDSTIKLNY